MITLTVLVASLVAGHALIKAWNWAAIAVARRHDEGTLATAR